MYVAVRLHNRELMNLCWLSELMKWSQASRDRNLFKKHKIKILPPNQPVSFDCQ